MTRDRRSFIAAIVLAAAQLAPAPAMAGPLLAAVRRAVARKAAQQSAARTASTNPEEPRDVIISRNRHPQAAEHIDYAQRQGQPSILHIDRAGASQRRAASTGSVDPHRKPAPHYDRDEYPPALVREGGGNANVRYIDRRDNRGAGGSMRAQTHDLPDGARIRVVIGK
jgi:Deoxyribonuclease NucA/NucB